MMKRWIAAVGIFILLLSLAACTRKEYAVENERELSVAELTLSEEMKEKIQTAYYEEHPRKYGQPDEWFWRDLKDPAPRYYDGYRYYGTFEDCVVWFVGSTADMYWQITVAGSVFSHSEWGNLIVYRDGKNYQLSEAYALGYISAEDVAIVAQRHEAFNQAIHEAIAQRVERESK